MDIELTDVEKAYVTPHGRVEVFKNFNLSVGAGEVVAILGPNGCGKSTLFNLIIGLDHAYGGRVTFDGRASRTNNQMGYMMQRDLLLPWRTAYSNITVGLEVQRRVNAKTKAEVLMYLERLGVSDLRSNFPSQLSGGERQKIALIRTLVLDSAILLLDEPFSAIDYNTRLELQEHIRAFAKEKGRTVLLITHDIDEAIMVGDRAIVLNDKPDGILMDTPILFDFENRTQLAVKNAREYPTYFSETWAALSGASKK